MGPAMPLPAHRPEAVRNGLGVHHQAPPAAIGIVVHLLLLVQGIVPDLAAADIQHALGPGPSHNAFGQHRLAHFRKQGQQINLHHPAVL